MSTFQHLGVNSIMDDVEAQAMDRCKLSNPVHPDTQFLAVSDPPKSSSPSLRILKSGILYKKGGFTGAMYNPRLFELQANGQLNYYIIDRDGQKMKRGGIVLSSSTKIEKRSGGRKRAAKFIIHHPLEDKEWYLWCNYPAVPASNENTFISLSDALKMNPKQMNGRNATQNTMWPFHKLMDRSSSQKKGVLSNTSESSLRPRNGKEAADEWCNLLSGMVSECKKKRMCKTFR